MTAPQYGMPMVGTPIGLPGPPHIPMGIPAGLQAHSIKNMTKSHIPAPVKHFRMNVKQEPGFNYPDPPHGVHITETTVAPKFWFKQPQASKYRNSPGEVASSATVPRASSVRSTRKAAGQPGMGYQARSAGPVQGHAGPQGQLNHDGALPRKGRSSTGGTACSVPPCGACRTSRSESISQRAFFRRPRYRTSMTMVPSLRSPAAGRMRVAGMVWMATVLAAALAVADEPPVHYLHAGAMPPGAIGGLQLQRGGPLPGYFQPVEIMAPEGAMISLADGAGFLRPAPGPLGAGMLIGAVYRLKVTNIPNHEGLEVYPTIEVIDRLYPPIGQERRFPIPIEITQEEIEMALSGRFVTRVIYLEDPQYPLAGRRATRRTNLFRDLRRATIRSTWPIAWAGRWRFSAGRPAARRRRTRRHVFV